MRRAAAIALLLLGLTLPAPAHATFPGKNGKIAFASNRDGDYEIYSMNADGSGVTKLTDNAANDLEPAWSPDGTKIAFTTDRDPSDPECDGFFVPCNTEIYVMNSDGSQPTRLTDTTGEAESAPAWTPDGKSVSYTVLEGCGSFGCSAFIVTKSLDGSSERFFRGTCPSVVDPAWSPDGTRLVYEEQQLDVFCGGTRLETANPDASNRQSLGVDGNEPDWAPDQSSIAFTQFGLSRIAKVNPDGTGLTVIHQNAVDAAWAPDGSRIVFSNNADGNREIYTTSPTGTDDARLTNDPAFDIEPDWQPVLGPQRGDYKNAAKFCKADRDFLGGEAFARKYGENGTEANAFGKCVSQNH